MSPKLDTLISVGNQLSNLAFNLKQRPGHELTESECAAFADLQQRWDAARYALREEAASCGDSNGGER